MGGERETTLQSPKGGAAGKKTTIAQPTGRTPIRVHQSGGEVHFHDDTGKRKVAVPAAKWWKAWEALQGALPGAPRTFSYVDTQENAILLVSVTCEQAKAGDPYTMATLIGIEPCVSDDSFTKLATFTGGSPK